MFKRKKAPEPASTAEPGAEEDDVDVDLESDAGDEAVAAAESEADTSAAATSAATAATAATVTPTKKAAGLAARGVGSFLTDDTHVVGAVTTRGSLTVAGEVEGDVKAESLTIERDAEITGDVRAVRLDVRGKIKGNVQTTGKLSIAASGAVVGDVRAGSVVVEDGGTLDGRFTMGKK